MNKYTHMYGFGLDTPLLCFQMSGFSGALKLGDLDDFLSPASECVVVVHQEDNKPKPGIIKAKQADSSKEKIAAVSLSDCLACTGCVTSAETMLLQSQSVDELLTKASSFKLLVTLSTASRRALAEHFNVDPSELCDFVAARLSRVIDTNIFVTDVSTAESVSILETVRETSSSVILSSHCPGWTCYATKTVEQSILDKLARTKSGEQIHGQFIKSLIPAIQAALQFRRMIFPDLFRYISRFTGSPKPIFHVVVSPCFDKKLENIRPDYSAGPYRAVDLVLASTELVDLIHRGIRTESLNLSRPIDVYDVVGLRTTWAPSRDTSAVESGGYAHTKSGFGYWATGKNLDLLEGESSLRSRGFRNIQNITKRIRIDKLGTTKFVEIMACPGGCPRGGGQPTREASDNVGSENIFRKVKKWFAQEPELVDADSVEFACPPAEYAVGINLRRLLVNYFGSEEAYYAQIRTEWKSLVVIDKATGQPKTTASDLKW